MLKAEDIMTRDVHTVTPETSIEELAKIFVETRVNALPVVEDGELFGQVSQNDLVERDKPLHIPTVISIFDWVIYLESDKLFREEVRKMAARTVRDICRTGVPTCEPATPVTEVAALMAGKAAHLVPVVENNRVVGVVGRLDIIRSMG